MRRRGSHRLLNISLAIVLAVVAAGTYMVIARGKGASDSSSGTATATVQRGTVRATVSASATVEAPRDLGLNSTTAGTITSVDVKVGQQVKAGQIVAHIDDTSAQQNLAQASASLASAEATLAKAEQGQTAADKKVAAAQIASARAAVRSAKSALEHEHQVAAANAAQYQQQVDAAQATLDDAVAQQTSDQEQLVSDEGVEGQECSLDPAGASCQSATAAVEADQAQLTQDATQITQDENSLAAAQASQTVGLARDQQTIAQDRSQVRSAKRSLASTIASNRASAVTDPAAIAQDRAAVTSAQTQVDQANASLAGTVLRAPMAGTVVSVSGVAGQVVSASGNTVSTAASSSSSSSTTGDSSATGVVVISDLGHLELRADFSETDTAKLKIGQKVSATLNAISSVTLHGTVVAIDPTSTVVNNVVDYGVTIHLNHQPASLSQGQTANVEVVTGVAHHALYVPSAAVQTAAGQDTVTVLGADGRRTTTTVQVGLQGDQTIQITSGLSEGQRVVISSSSTGTNGFPGGGFPGGGGIGGVTQIGGGG